MDLWALDVITGVTYYTLITYHNQTVGVRFLYSPNDEMPKRQRSVYQIRRLLAGMKSASPR